MSRLTVNDLISALEEMAEAGHGDLEVRMAHQESWPLQSWLRPELAVRTVKDGSALRAVYLLESSQCYDSPYAPSGIFKGRLEDAPAEVYCPGCERTLVNRLPAEHMYQCGLCGEVFDARDLPDEE